MMFGDDDQNRPKPKAYLVGQDVSAFSVAEITETMARLEAEITRLAQIRTQKLSSAAAADALFRTSS